ncbi:MAG: methyltransferase domain-containing protein, partial [Bacteroidetes bacterium]
MIMNQVAELENTVNRAELEARVKAMYREVALAPEGAFHFEMGRALAERLGYPAELLNDVPAAAIHSFAGVGYHFGLAGLRPGENVVDMGSGSGMDVFFAARQVGPAGEVIGIDMTPEQLAKSQLVAEKNQRTNTIFLNGYIEELPIISGCLDVVISNGVINLSSD